MTVEKYWYPKASGIFASAYMGAGLMATQSRFSSRPRVRAIATCVEPSSTSVAVTFFDCTMACSLPMPDGLSRTTLTPLFSVNGLI